MVQLARSGKTPKDLITKDVLENAIMFDMAVAGSTNAVLHILAYAYELGIKLTPVSYTHLKEVEIQCTMYQTARKSADFMNVRNVAIAFCLYRQ